MGVKEMISSKVIRGRILEIKNYIKMNELISAERGCDNVLDYIIATDKVHDSRTKKLNIGEVKKLMRESYRMGVDCMTNKEFTEFVNNEKTFKDLF
jgi:hypothetical protein